MKKECDNCKNKNTTMIGDLVCTNKISAYFSELVRKDGLCKCWEKNSKESD